MRGPIKCNAGNQREINLIEANLRAARARFVDAPHAGREIFMGRHVVQR